MPAVVFLTHVPLVRLADDEVPFAGGELTRLAWEIYDTVSLGAFSDFQQLYEATAPVFYRVDAPDLAVPPIVSAPPDGGMLELSMPARTWDEFLPSVGLDLIASYARAALDPAWIALVLGAPGAAPASPRLSATFVVAGDEMTSFARRDHNYSGIRVDGDAGSQLLFSPRAAGSPITRDAVERANRLVVRMAERPPESEVSAAIGALCALTHPSLTPDQQSTLAVVALEALLLPNVTTKLRATFARRVGALLAPEADRPELERVAKKLYDARSSSLHSHDGGAAPAAEAQRLLAAAIETLLYEDDDVAAVCARLDEGDGADSPFAATPGADGMSARDRMRARIPKTSAGFSFGVGAHSMAGAEGTLLSWSPLVGLTGEGDIRFAEDSGALLTTVTPSSILSLEDKDVRRELGNLNMIDTPVACLGIAQADGAELEPDLEPILRRRDLTVVALRLAGFTAFVDPELLGVYVFRGTLRTIDPSAFALDVLRGMGAEPQQSFGAADVEHFGENWRLVTTYDMGSRHPQVDHVLTLFRRAHDREYLPPDARAGLMLAMLETMLGRFRGPDDPVQLEDLVTSVAGADDPEAAWFAEHGRPLRNAIAHGYWDHDPEPLEHVQTLLRPLLRAFLSRWMLAGAHDRVPADVLIETATADAQR